MKKLFDFPKLIKSFEVAFQGLKIALREQTFRIFALVTLLVVILMIVFQIPLHQKLMLILIITFALALELINSQIERMLDIFCPAHHPEVKLIKDIAAGAVLLVAIGAAIIGLLIFLPYVLNFFGK